jgi:hypothetical protein
MAPAATPQAEPNFGAMKGSVEPLKLPGMPPNVTPDEIMPYLQSQKTQLNRFGPQQRMDVQNSLNERQNSLGYKLTDAGKGFADALMMGVARAGNPNWQGQFQQQEQQNAQNQIGALKDAGDLNTRQVESNMALDKMNPTSALSKEMQKTYAPLFQKLGYPTDKLNGMSAANIDSAMQLMAAYGGKEMEAAIKEFEAGIERMKLAAASGKASSQEELERQKLGLEKRKLEKDAATELLKGTKNTRVWGMPIPFTSDTSGEEEDLARKSLVSQLETPSGDFDSYYKSLSSGSTYVGPDGKTRTKK